MKENNFQIELKNKLKLLKTYTFYKNYYVYNFRKDCINYNVMNFFSNNNIILDMFYQRRKYYYFTIINKSNEIFIDYFIHNKIMFMVVKLFSKQKIVKNTYNAFLLEFKNFLQSCANINQKQHVKIFYVTFCFLYNYENSTKIIYDIIKLIKKYIPIIFILFSFENDINNKIKNILNNNNNIINYIGKVGYQDMLDYEFNSKNYKIRCDDYSVNDTNHLSYNKLLYNFILCLVF